MRVLEKKDIDPSEWEFEFQQRNHNCVMMADLHCRGLFQNLPSEVGLPVRGYDYIFTDSSRGFAKFDQKNDLLEKLRTALFDKKYLADFFKKTVSKMEQFLVLAEEIVPKLAKEVNSDELQKMWIDFGRSYLEMMPWLYIPWYASEENMLTDRVRTGLNRHKAEIEKIAPLETALILLVFPTKKALFQLGQEAYFDLVELYSNGKAETEEFKNKVGNYLEQFGWFRTFWFLSILPMGEDELLEAIKTSAEKNELPDFRNQQKRGKKDSEQARKLIDILRNDPELIFDIEASRELGWALTYGVELGHKGGAKFRPLYDAISKRLGITAEEFTYLTFDEVEAGLKGQKLPDLARRREGVFFPVLDGVARPVYGRKGKEMSEWFERTVMGSEKQVENISGKSASPGIAKGRVVIAMTPKESYRLKVGEILVCSMTGPDYVPAMRRSSAVVTDEGGLLSHAAIMSREFGKPCIVGTKIATRVLKDGDVVEVDAEQGIVRKIV